MGDQQTEWTVTDENVRDLHRALLEKREEEDGAAGSEAPLAVSQSMPALGQAEAHRVAEPGGFRRDFLRRRAEEAGDHSPTRAYDVSLVEILNERSILNRIASYAEFPYGMLYDEDGNLVAPDKRQVAADASNAQVGLAIFKAFVAEGIMFLPGAFRNGGWLVSTVVMVAVAYISKMGIYMIVECYAVCPGSFGDIAHAAAGPGGRLAVEASLILSQFAICCAMLIFSLQAIEVVLSPGPDARAFRVWVMVAMVVLVAPLAWIRRIHKLAVSNLVANVFVVAGIGMSLYFFIAELAEHGPPPDVRWGRASTFTLFLGTSCYTFEGIPLMLPIYESMRDKAAFPRVFNLTFWIAVAVLEIGYALLGYLAYGEGVNPISILSVPLNKGTRAVILGFAGAVVLSFPMMFVPAARIVESLIWKAPGTPEERAAAQEPRAVLCRKWSKNLFRTSLVLALGAISFFGSEFVEQFVALAGSLCCVPLAFIYPAWFHLKLMERDAPHRAAAAAMVVCGVALIPITLVQVLGPLL